LSLFGDN